MKKLRLVKVIVHPVFVIDDGQNIEEMPLHPPVTIPAAEWSSYSAERFPREVIAWQQRLEEESADSDGTSLNRSNRATPATR